jgi:CheY-like chemotaxis protein
VLSASAGSEAVAMFAAEGADLLLTDLSMPGMDGITLIHKVREQAPGTPAILITGYAIEHARASERRPFRTLYKPVSPARLYEEIASCLNGGGR